MAVSAKVQAQRDARKWKNQPSALTNGNFNRGTNDTSIGQHLNAVTRNRTSGNWDKQIAADTAHWKKQLGEGVYNGTVNPYADTTPAPDPYAKYGGKAAHDKQVAGFGRQRDNIYDTSLSAANTSRRGILDSLSDLELSKRQGVRSLNNQGIDADLAKRQGYVNITDMVGRGIKSGGLMLGNRNAGSSSGVGAIAQAYGDIGRRELSGVGQDYESAQRAIDEANQTLLEQQGMGFRKIEKSKKDSINEIMMDARDRLASLDAAMTDADLPDRIAIEQERNKLKNQVRAKLSGFDKQFGAIKAIKPMDRESRRAEAYERFSEGVAPESSFSYTDSAPMEFNNTGPYASPLPFFTFPRSGREDQREL